MALTAEQQIDFMANHDFGERHSVLVEQPSSRRSLIGEAAVDMSGRRIGERLADTLDKIVPHWREDATQARGTSTVGMPSSRAISTACNGPAPPKAKRAKSRGSCPFSTDTRRIACAS